MAIWCGRSWRGLVTPATSVDASTAVGKLCCEALVPGEGDEAFRAQRH